MSFRKFLAGISALIVIATSAAQAQDGPQYQPVTFGYSGCTVAFGATQGGFSLDGMTRLATEEGAYGFTYDADSQLGQLITAPFPATCRPPVGNDRRLYLPNGPILDYARQDFGFDGCDVTFGPLMTDTDEDAMIMAARLANAIGFAFQPSLAYGSLITGDYPLGCKSAPGGSWPLYLAKGSQAQYVQQSFGFDGCNVKFGPLQQNTTRELMNVLASQAGAVGFTFKESLGYGNVIVGPYPPSCKSDPNMSWPLFLLHTP